MSDGMQIGNQYNNYQVGDKFEKWQFGMKPAKPQEEFVTDWQMPADQSSVTIPVETKKPSKQKEAAPEVQKEQPSTVKHEKMLILDDGIGNKVIKGSSNFSDVPSTLFIEQPMEFPPPGTKEMTTIPWEFPAPDPLQEIGPITVKEFPTAGPDTEFYGTGLNSIAGVAKDGLFGIDGNKIA
jgi:hypothetical protein